MRWQEAIPVGAVAALGPQDRVIATYRGHGWALASGVPLPALLAEVCQRADGVNGGRGGSPHLMSPEYGFIGENSIVGAGVPIATGVALAAQVADSGWCCRRQLWRRCNQPGRAPRGSGVRRLPPTSGRADLREQRLVGAHAHEQDHRSREPWRPGAGDRHRGVSVDGSDPFAVRAAVAVAAQRARDGEGPTFIECRCHRLWGHYNGDIEHYRSAADKQLAEESDPILLLRERLASDGMDAEAASIDAAVEREIEDAVGEMTETPPPYADSPNAHVVGPPAAPRDGGDEQAREMSYIHAVTAGLRAELTDRPDVVVYGEDVGHAGGIFGATRGLQTEFGEARVFDTPIAEAAILGSAVGAALSGLRPIVEIMWADFMLVALDQLINQAANVRYVSQGKLTAPMVVRTQQGVTPGSCAQHSQSLEALLAHIPGLRVGLPATPQDAYSMLRAAVADDDPVILIESRALYQTKGDVRTGGSLEGLGGAHLVRSGRDAGIIMGGRRSHVTQDGRRSGDRRIRRVGAGPQVARPTRRRGDRRDRGGKRRSYRRRARGQRDRRVRGRGRGAHHRRALRPPRRPGASSGDARRTHSIGAGCCSDSSSPVPTRSARPCAGRSTPRGVEPRRVRSVAPRLDR